MAEPIDTVEYKKHTIEIFPDQCCENPIQSWDMLADISILLILQLAAVIFASACTAICFWRIRVHHRNNNGKWGFWAWKFIFALCAVYLLGAIALIVYGGTVS
jgi:hypothetical protein